MIEQLRVYLAYHRLPGHTEQDRTNALIVGALIHLIEGQGTMDSRIRVIRDGVVGEQTSITALGTVVPLLVGLLASQGAALAAAQTTLAGEPSDEEIAGVSTDLGNLKIQTDNLVGALQAALPAPAPILSVSPTSDAIVIGGTTALSVTGPSTSGTTWSSSDETIATVDSSGVVTGVAAGTATISVHDAAGETADAVITVS